MVKISLGDGLFTIIDDSNYDKVSKYTWHVTPSNYAAATIGGVTILLHRFIINPPVGMVVDHIDGDRLDNRKNNLRVCTQGENLRNRLKHYRGGTSKYKGVSYNREAGKWLTRIRVENVKYGLGSYHDELDAALAYNIGSVLLSPKFGKLNVIPCINNERILSNYTCSKLVKVSKLSLGVTKEVLTKYKYERKRRD